MANPFIPAPQISGVSGVDGTNKDRLVQVGALQVGDTILQEADVAALETAGTVTTAATTVAEELGDGFSHITKITMTAFAVGTGGDTADLAIGAKFYTLPAGTIVVDDVSFVGGITYDANVTTDTPEVGIGTTIGVGAVAVLATTMEDIMEGGVAGYTGGTAVAPDVAGTSFSKGRINGGVPVAILTSGGKSHDLFLNVADAWANVDLVGPPVHTGAVTCTGVITLRWRKIS